MLGKNRFTSFQTSMSQPPSYEDDRPTLLTMPDGTVHFIYLGSLWKNAGPATVALQGRPRATREIVWSGTLWNRPEPIPAWMVKTLATSTIQDYVCNAGEGSPPFASDSDWCIPTYACRNPFTNKIKSHTRSMCSPDMKNGGFTCSFADPNDVARARNQPVWSKTDLCTPVYDCHMLPVPMYRKESMCRKTPKGFYECKTQEDGFPVTSTRDWCYPNAEWYECDNSFTKKPDILHTDECDEIPSRPGVYTCRTSNPGEQVIRKCSRQTGVYCDVDHLHSNKPLCKARSRPVSIKRADTPALVLPSSMAS